VPCGHVFINLNLIKMRVLLFYIIILLLFSTCRTQPGSNIPEFSQNYESHVRTLASDEFEGRAPTTAGGKKTKDYIEEQFRRIGLKPAVNGSYRQGVPLVELESYNVSDLVVRSNDTYLSLAYLSQMMAGTTLLEDYINLHDSEIVFAGYGIVAPEYEWDDYEGIDVAGKTVIVLVNDPGYEIKDDNIFTGRAMTYYGRWTYKYEEAARQGARAVFIVHEAGPAGYGWDVVRNSWSGPQYDMATENSEPVVPVQGWLQLSAAREILELAGHSFDDLKKRALRSDFTAVELDLRANISFEVRYHTSQSYNIAGYLQGSEYPDEVIIFMAHWDHLGKHITDDGVEIFNGAVDNATGTAAVIVLAERFAMMDPPPQRSLLFLAVTAEESGLIGSRYYAQNPLFPLETTVGGINIDGMNPYGPTRDIPLTGYNASEMQDYIERHARKQDRKVVPEPHPERGYFYRSDHFSLVRQGVPMLYASRGTEYLGQDEKYSEWVEQDLDARYHSPNDVVHEHWDWRGIHQDLWLYYEVGADLANSRHWPEWSQNSEFREIREQSDHVRE
jgi:Zn-dependent M28 family amino/carboxypeptidase